VLLALVPLGLGIGISETLSVDAVVSAVPPAKAGAASSVSETAYELGVALGIAVLGSLMTLLYRLRLDLPADVAGQATSRAEDSLASATSALQGHVEALAAAEHAFVSAMQLTTLVAGGVMVVGAGIALFLIPSTRAARSARTDATDETMSGAGVRDQGD
jgi:DHA2 family multidrug resistance protein-like MFS transporter